MVRSSSTEFQGVNYMYSAEFIYHLNDKTQYIVVAQCKTITNEFTVVGLSFKFINDDGDTVRVGYDRDLFDDIEVEATNQLLEDYYNPVNFMRSH